MGKVELFEQIRRAYFLEGESVHAVARQFGVHRRTVRQAVASAMPPPRQVPVRESPVLDAAVRAWIDAILESDRTAPRKQRHTARRLWQRLCAEKGFPGAESTVRRHVGRRRRELGEVHAFVPQVHLAGEEAEVDWFEAEVDFPEGRRTVQFFEMRACFSGRVFVVAFPRATQSAFLEAHALAFRYFGGVFHRVRYDNLTSAVRKVLRGRRRLEADRFVLLRSHYLFSAEFCRPGKEGAHEKGGVEGGVGRFRRRWLVPVPKLQDWEALDRLVATSIETDGQRVPEERRRTVLEAWAEEVPALLPLPREAFDAAEVTTPRVDAKCRVKVGSARYSAPSTLSGQKVEARAYARRVELRSAGQLVAVHERAEPGGDRLLLEHYLDLLRHRPMGLAGSQALAQERERGAWPPAYEELFAALRKRHGLSEGARQMVEVLLLHRKHPSESVQCAVALALELGCLEAGAVELVVRQLDERDAPLPSVIVPASLSPFERRPVDDDFAPYDVLWSGQGAHT